MIKDERGVAEVERLSARRVAFFTFGCKLNQCETAGIRAQFTAPGYAVVPFEESADIYVINTCSVTGRADAQARQLVRRVVRERGVSGARVVVTGCYAQRAPKELAAIPGVALVAGTGEKDRLREVVEGLGWGSEQAEGAEPANMALHGEPGQLVKKGATGSGPSTFRQEDRHEVRQATTNDAAFPNSASSRSASPELVKNFTTRSRTSSFGKENQHETAAPIVLVSDLRKSHRSFDLSPVEFGERTRAFLRVQDGCDAACSFCIIPHLRGRSTSIPMESAVNRVRGLVERGYKEIVLTGIHLGMFGHDVLTTEGAEPPTLAALIRLIDDLPGEFRIRLSSIEPQEIDDGIIDLMADPASRLVPHLHVPLQSGCDRILQLMNRTYSASEYRHVVERMTKRVDPLGLGADVIIGFPGETDADFNETVKFIEDQPFTYLHVFPYSPRPGTRAASLPGRPHGDVVEERSGVLRDLSDRKRREFLKKMIGRRVSVLVEEPSGETAWEGWSEHYARVAFDWEGGDDLTNRLVEVTGRAVDQDVVVSEWLEFQNG